MPVISVNDISKAFDHRVVLDGVSLTVRSGERIGVVGANGCGKSTLARILAGEVEADSGTLALRRGARVAYLAQQPQLDPGQSAAEAVLSGMDAWTLAKLRYERAVAGLQSTDGHAQKWIAEQAAAADELERQGGWERLHEAESILGRLGIENVDVRIGDLSVGRRRAVALSKVLVSRPALALLDEPTNHLDVERIEWLESYLRNQYDGALLLITHDRYILDRVATRTIEIANGSLYSYEGGYEEYLEAKAERSAQARRVEANRRNFLRRELEWLRRSPKARRGKQKARVERAERAVATPAPSNERSVELRIAAGRSGKSILDVAGLGIEMGGQRLVSGLHFGLVAGERIGIVGPNGCGKTTLLRTLLGELEPASGSVVIGKNTQVAYLDQMRSGLDEHASVEENVAGDRGYLQIGGRTVAVRSYMEQFLFDPPAARARVGTLSGGERARVALAKLLASSANLLVLDEPTNDLDVATLAALESMILDFSGTALIVSHDRWFLDRLATSILAFEKDGRVRRYSGNYSDYREALAVRGEAKAKASGSDTKTREQAKADGKKQRNGGSAGGSRKLTYAERLELEELLPRIEEAESSIAALEAQLADPKLYAAGGQGVKDLMARLEATKASAAELTARWEELEAKPR